MVSAHFKRCWVGGRETPCPAKSPLSDAIRGCTVTRDASDPITVFFSRKFLFFVFHERKLNLQVEQVEEKIEVQPAPSRVIVDCSQLSTVFVQSLCCLICSLTDDQWLIEGHIMWRSRVRRGTCDKKASWDKAGGNEDSTGDDFQDEEPHCFSERRCELDLLRRVNMPTRGAQQHVERKHELGLSLSLKEIHFGVLH